MVTCNRHAHAFVPIDLFRRTSVQLINGKELVIHFSFIAFAYFFSTHLNLDETFFSGKWDNFEFPHHLVTIRLIRTAQCNYVLMGKDFGYCC